MSNYKEHIDIIKHIKSKNWIRERLINKNGCKMCINGHLLKEIGLMDKDEISLYDDEGLSECAYILRLHDKIIMDLATINDDYDLNLRQVKKLAIEYLNLCEQYNPHRLNYDITNKRIEIY